MKSIKLKDLDGVSDIRRGRTIMREELLKSGDLLHLTPRHIHRNDNKLFLSDKDKYVSNKFIQKNQYFEKFILNPSDVIITAKGASVGKIYTYKKFDPPAVVGDLLILIKANQNKYLVRYLEIKEFRDKFELDFQEKLSNKSGVFPYMTISNFLEIEVLLFPNDELAKLESFMKKI
tara:strand:+ start:94 stop:621 length:528 start_codon:yes stop_codon:yes gene_type:complete